MLIDAGFLTKWETKGHRYGMCMSHPDRDLAYINIPKNATSWTKPNLRDWNWEVYNYHHDSFIRDKTKIVALREPIDRWISGIAEYFALYYQSYTPDDMTPMLIDMVFDQVTFDDHTEQQTHFLHGLDTDSCVFLKCNSAYRINFGRLLKEHSMMNNYENYNYQNTSGESPIRNRWKEFFSEQIEKQPEYFERLRRYFSADYELYNTVKYYGSDHPLNLSVLATFGSNYPRGAHYTGPEIANKCDMPWKSLSIDRSGNCFVCICEAHLPIPIGKINDFGNLRDIWTNDQTQQLQQTITDKKFTYCAIEHCGITQAPIKLDEYRISVNIDESCNLACPSCRRAPVNHTTGDYFEKSKSQVEHFVKLLNNFRLPLYLTMTGNGDPLASLIMRPLVLDWQPRARQRVQLFTNGHLMKKLLPDSTILNNISDFKISVDAGSESVYENVRKPGKFKNLRENLDWLAENRRPGVNVRLMYCLQAANANDVVNFAEMCNNYNFIGEITKLDNWFTFDDFNSQNVVDNRAHPLRSTAIDQLRQIQDRPNIVLSNPVKRILL